MREQQEEMAVILARVSTQYQAQQGTSMDDQVAVCTDFAKRQGWGIRQIYREDGKSGGLYATRSALQSALLDIEQKRANLFVTYAIDRSGRESHILNQIRSRVIEAGGRYILSNGMEFEDTPEGDLMFGTMANQAQYEKANIRRRTVGGRVSRAKEGKQPSRTLSPFGYHVVKKADVLMGLYPANLLGFYQVIPDKLRWAKEACTRFAAGESMRDVQRWFYENGVLSPSGLPKWSLSSIRRLLSHPVYMGKPAFGRTKRKFNEARVGRIGGNGKTLKRPDYSVARPEEEWIKLEAEPCVSEAIWDECQRRLAANRSKLGGNPKRKYMLGSMVVCPLCSRVTGGSTANNKKRSRYYKCPYGCKWEVTAISAEAFTAQAVITLAERPELIGTALRAYEAKHASAFDKTAEPRLRDELTRLEKQGKAALEAELETRLEDPSPERDVRVKVYREKQKEIAAKAEALRARLAAVQEIEQQHQEVLSDGAKIAAAVASVREALESEHLTPVEKNEILSAVVAAIKPTQDRNHMVLVLQPFFCGIPSETVPQILIRVISSF